MSDHTHQAHVHAVAIAIELPTGEKRLVAQILIDCPLCGVQEIRVAGHHLRSIRDFAIDTIDKFPDLTGADAIQREHTEWQGRLVGRPDEN
jgi:hypothetical protein